MFGKHNKTTILAICAALAVSACGSSGVGQDDDVDVEHRRPAGRAYRRPVLVVDRAG